MATLPRDFRVHSYPPEPEKASRAPWPPEMVSLIVLLATVATCFILVWTGLALVSWHVVNMREASENGRMGNNYEEHDKYGGDAISPKGDNRTHVQESDYEFNSDVYSDEDRIIHWPGVIGGKLIFAQRMTMNHDQRVPGIATVYSLS